MQSVPSAHTPGLRPVLALADLAALGLAIWLAHVVRFAPVGWLSMKWQDLQSSPGLLLWGGFAAWVLAAAAELYEPEVLRRGIEVRIRALVVAGLWSMSVVIASYLASPRVAYGRGLLALTAAIWSLALILNRRVAAALAERRGRIVALVVGDPAGAERLCREIESHPAAPWRPFNASGLPLTQVPNQVEELEAGLIAVASGDDFDPGVETGILHTAGVPVVSSLDIWALLEERLPLATLPAALYVHQPGFGAVHWSLFNRLTSVLNPVLALLLLVAGLPVLVLAALSILVIDGRPVLFRQTRMGRFGRPFEIFKLRTMVRDAEKEGPEFSTDDDPRVTRLGRILRRLRIDELPQLINVLRGEMALVGPRPERPEFVDGLARQIPFYTFRLAVRPGLTGWAQVNAPYASDLEGHRRKLEFDLYFIRERSLRLYVLTLLRTASAALVGARRGQPPAEVEPRSAPEVSRP